MIHALTQDAGLVADDRCYGADHTILLLMFIMILFRCLVFIINVMYIIRCKGHIKTHDVIVCLYLLQSFDEISSCHVTAYVGFPTMLGMNDVMYLVVIFWYIPTWLGYGCMYEYLVLGRSRMMYRVMFLQNTFFHTLLIDRGSISCIVGIMEEVHHGCWSEYCCNTSLSLS